MSSSEITPDALEGTLLILLEAQAGKSLDSHSVEDEDAISVDVSALVWFVTKALPNVAASAVRQAFQRLINKGHLAFVIRWPLQLDLARKGCRVKLTDAGHLVARPLLPKIQEALAAERAGAPRVTIALKCEGLHDVTFLRARLVAEHKPGSSSIPKVGVVVGMLVLIKVLDLHLRRAPQQALGEAFSRGVSLGFGPSRGPTGSKLIVRREAISIALRGLRSIVPLVSEEQGSSVHWRLSQPFDVNFANSHGSLLDPGAVMDKVRQCIRPEEFWAALDQGKHGIFRPKGVSMGNPDSRQSAGEGASDEEGAPQDEVPEDLCEDEGEVN